MTKEKSTSRQCIVCCSNESSSNKLFRCSSCYSGLFCSRKCQRDSWDHHKALCKYICQLESQQQSRQMDSANKMSLGSSLNYKQRNKLVNLVGRKCVVTCSINGIPTDALLDTGAQITCISSDWKEQNLPKLKLQPIERLLGISDLELQAVNGTTVPYVGWVETSFAFGEESSVRKLSVPVLVVNQELERPVIGYNVIEQLIQKNDDENCFPDTNPIDTLKYSFQDLGIKQVTALINFVGKKLNTPDDFGTVKLSKQNVVIPQGKTIPVTCRVRVGPVPERMPVVFEPTIDTDVPDDLVVSESLTYLQKGRSCSITVLVQNPTNHDIVIKGRTILGSLKAISTMVQIPCNWSTSENSDNSEEIGSNSDASECKVDMSQTVTQENHERDESKQWDPDIDLSHLTKDQQEAVRKVLREECAVFAKDENDIGNATDLKLKINLSNDTPVKKSYISIPPPLYKEVKEYLENLLVNGWIQRSTSSYASPVVCVRKKDGGLRLCVDYR